MCNSTPVHFSNNLELDFAKRKSFLTDRAELKLLLPGVVFGFLLFLLGIYDSCNMLRGGEKIFLLQDIVSHKPLVAAWFFDACFMLVGLGMMLSNIFLYIRYNKYKFLGQKVLIVKRPFGHPKQIIEENIRNYVGVRFRVEFVQTGFLNKNKYIIELYHPNPNKNVPLYLSTSPDGVRKKWKEYARLFKLPALINTDNGLKTIERKNLSKSLCALYKLGLIEDTYDAYDNLPPTITFVRKKDKMVLKVRKIVWDIYNIFAWMAIVCMGCFGAFILFNLNSFKQSTHPSLYTLLLIIAIIIFVAVQILFRKEKLVIKKHKIVNTHKYMLFSTKHNQILKKDIEAIEVTENPATGRYFVSIISEDNTITFGAKMKIKDLHWIKRFLIHEIIN